MRHPLVILLFTVAVLITAGCGFSLRSTTSVPQDLQILVLDTPDPYGPLARAVRNQLRQNGVTIVDGTAQEGLPSLRLRGGGSGRDTVSIFQSGTTAEYQMVMSASAHVVIPEKGIYPIHAKTYRSFFDNPLTALAKDAEQEMIYHEMRQQLAQQLVRKLFTVQTTEKSLPKEDASLQPNDSDADAFIR